MAELTKKQMIDIVEENIGKIKDKKFNIYFYIFDTKGNPSGSLEYIYQTAYTLKELGYNVIMLHQEEDFVGVGDWMGSKYADLPHKNHAKENVDLSASDFLIIPDIFVNVMIKVKASPCKKIALVQNYNWLCEAMPVVATFRDLKIFDIITTTESQKETLQGFFPDMNIFVVSPSISPVFRNNDGPRKLVVNIVSKNQADVHKVIKPFYWKYPLYKWVSFRELRGLPQEAFSNELRENAIFVWIDEDTNFGYSALEALRSGSIVLAKTTKRSLDWNYQKDEEGFEELTDACLWFDNIDMVPDMLASVIRTWTLDKIPQRLYDNMHKLDDQYSRETQKKEIEYVYEKQLIEQRIKDFEETLTLIKNKK